jgi:hypothetical protein
MPYISNNIFLKKNNELIINYTREFSSMFITNNLNLPIIFIISIIYYRITIILNL